MSDSDSANTVLGRIAAGESAAVRDCMKTYGGLVWSIARRLTPSKEDAEDAVQEIFLDIWRHAPRFDAAQGSEKVFITMIARRRLIDRLRYNERRSPIQNLPADLIALADRTVVDEGSAGEICVDAALAATALKRLSNDQQVALKLSILLGLTHSEIAQATGLPLGTVKTHIRRGLLQVREHMVALDHDRDSFQPKELSP